MGEKKKQINDHEAGMGLTNMVVDYLSKCLSVKVYATLGTVVCTKAVVWS